MGSIQVLYEETKEKIKDEHWSVGCVYGQRTWRTHWHSSQQLTSSSTCQLWQNCTYECFINTTDFRISSSTPNHFLSFFLFVLKEKEIKNKEGFASLFAKAFATVNSMSVFAYAIEVWFVHKVDSSLHFTSLHFISRFFSFLLLFPLLFLSLDLCFVCSDSIDCFISFICRLWNVKISITNNFLKFNKKLIMLCIHRLRHPLLTICHCFFWDFLWHNKVHWDEIHSIWCDARNTFSNINLKLSNFLILPISLMNTNDFLQCIQTFSHFIYFFISIHAVHFWNHF